MLEVHNLTVHYGECMILHDVCFSLYAGQWLMVVGPNGAGKTTLVNAISQGIPYRGSIHFDGKNLRLLQPRLLAKKIGVLSQHHPVGYAFTVEEVVRLGQYARENDPDQIEAALRQTGMLPHRKQSILTLSGGELQRTFLAQILAQDPQVLLLDEPTNHLDLAYQKQTFEWIGAWLQHPGRAVLSVAHDLSIARAYGTDALILHRGEQVACGPSPAVLNRQTLQSVYSMDVHQWMLDLLCPWQEEET